VPKHRGAPICGNVHTENDEKHVEVIYDGTSLNISNRKLMWKILSKGASGLLVSRETEDIPN
jgi:hypothetical protein